MSTYLCCPARRSLTSEPTAHSQYNGPLLSRLRPHIRLTSRISYKRSKLYEECCALGYFLFLFMTTTAVFFDPPLGQHEHMSRLRSLLDAVSATRASRRKSDRYTAPYKLKSSRYRRLRRGEIRLMLLEPGSEHDAIEFCMIHCNLSRCFRYEALSYAWGTGKPDQTCMQDGQETLVTRNLSQALRSLRLKDRSRLLWVDAICIDQYDDYEKKEQVQQMPRIYNQATQVIVWLGTWSTAASEAFSWNEPLRSKTQASWFRDVRPGFVFEPQPLDFVRRPPDWRLLNDFLEFPWFRRAWVLQEVIYGKRVMIRCGKRHMHWSDFQTSVAAISRDGRFLELLSDTAQQSVKNIMAMSRTTHSGFSQPSLLSVLLKTNTTQCQNPIDKIYAVLSLSREAQDFSIFQPDYTISTLEAYENCAELMMETSGRPDVLCCTSSPSTFPWTPAAPLDMVKSAPDNKIEDAPNENPPEFRPHDDDALQSGLQNEYNYGYGLDPTVYARSSPVECSPSTLASWAPDWTRLENDDLFVAIDGLPFRASVIQHKQTPELSFGELRVRIVRVDVIQTVHGASAFVKTPLHTNIIDRAKLIRSLEWITSCLKIAETSMHPREVWRVMTCDLTGQAERVPPEFGQRFKRYLEFLRLAKTCILSDRSSESLQELVSGFRWDIVAIESSIYRWSSRRQFAVSQNGRLAFVPKAAKPGDIICTLAGLPVPIILRHLSTDVYQSIGEAYVHGIMYGEDAATERRPESRIIRIK